MSINKTVLPPVSPTEDKESTLTVDSGRSQSLVRTLPEAFSDYTKEYPVSAGLYSCWTARSVRFLSGLHLVASVNRD